VQKSFAIHGWEIFPVGFLDEEVEVVGHHDVSDDAEPEKSLKFFASERRRAPVPRHQG
jgi:hypothetical protein